LRRPLQSEHVPIVSWLQGAPVQERQPHRVEIEAEARPHFGRGPLNPQLRLVPVTKVAVELTTEVGSELSVELEPGPKLEPESKLEVEPILGVELVLKLAVKSVLGLGSEPKVESGLKSAAEPGPKPEVVSAGFLPEPNIPRLTRSPGFPSGTIRKGSARAVKVYLSTSGCVREAC